MHQNRSTPLLTIGCFFFPITVRTDAELTEQLVTGSPFIFHESCMSSTGLTMTVYMLTRKCWLQRRFWANCLSESCQLLAVKFVLQSNHTCMLFYEREIVIFAVKLSTCDLLLLQHLWSVSECLL